MKSLISLMRAVCVAGAFLWSIAAPAATVTWSGAGADDDLANPANWAGGVAPAAGDDVLFTGLTRNAPTSSGQQTYFTITFDGAAGPFVLGGSAIVTGTTAPAGGSVTNLSPYTQTFNCAFQPRLGTLMASNGDIVLNGGFNVGNSGNSSGRNVTVDGPRNVVVNTSLTGSGTDSSSGGQLIKSGAGTLFLNASSPLWTGKITVNLGAVVITNDSALGSAVGTTVIGSSGDGRLWDGRVVLSNNVVVAEPFTLGARQQGSLNFAHILNAGGTNTLAGNLSFTTGGSRYNLESDAGKLITTGTNNAGTLTGTRELRLAGAAEGELRGPIVGGGASILFQLIKEGSGLWTLTGTNAVNGNTLVNAGRLALGPTGRITGSTNVSVASGATLDVSAVSGGFTLAGNQTLAGSGVVTGSVAVAEGGQVRPGGPLMAGTLTFANDLVESATTTNYFELGGYTPPGGAHDLITVAGDLEPNGAVVVVSSLSQLVVPGTYRLFNYSGSKTTGFGGVVNADTRYALALDENTLGRVNLVVSGSPASLVWSGGAAGNWDVNASASWNADTERFFQSDVVAFDDTAATTTVTLTGTLYPGTLTVAAATNYVFQGPGRLSGTVGLTKSGSGSLTLNNSNDFSGVVNVTGGTLVAGHAAALGATNGGTVIFAGATLDVFNKNLGLEPITVAGAGVGGAGAIVNSGAEQLNAVRLLSLSDDAAMGGLNRWDVRGAGGNGSFSGRLDLGGHTLTKVGTNKISIVDTLATNAGNLVVGGGTLAATRSRIEGAGFIDLQTNFFQIENFSTGYITKPLISSGGRLLVSGNPFTLGSAITNLAGLTIDNGVDLVLTNEFGGAGGLTKVGAGLLIFQRPAAHAGPTTISGGSMALAAGSGLPNSPLITVGGGATLDASALSGGLVIGSGRTLGGDGTMLGALTVGAGGTLAPGVALGTLSVSNDVTLGGTSLMEVIKAGGVITNDLLRGVGALAYGGTLQLVLSGEALGAGDTLKLFDAASYAGSFGALLPATPGAGLAWDTSKLATDGTLRVNSLAAPAITAWTVLPDGNFRLSLIGTLGQHFTVRSTSDLAVPLADWTVLERSTIPSVPYAFDDLSATNYSQRFYIVSAP